MIFFGPIHVFIVPFANSMAKNVFFRTCKGLITTSSESINDAWIVKCVIEKGFNKHVKEHCLESACRFLAEFYYGGPRWIL